MDRDLIGYLPKVVQGCTDFAALTTGEQPEFEQAWNEADALLDNQFILTAGELGISRWEQILGITPKGTDSIEDRRFRVLTRMNEELPYTLPQLRNILDTLCGSENYSAELISNGYTLIVKIALAVKSNYTDVEALLGRIVPVNMVIDLQQLYNTHVELSVFTHAQLSAYTHHQLRNEVMH